MTTFPLYRAYRKLHLAIAVLLSCWFWNASTAGAQPLETKELAVQIEAVAHQPPPNDPLQEFTPGPFAGQLVYIAYVIEPKPEPHWQHFLVLRRAGQDNASADTKSLTSLRVKVAERAFDPQFSPDGTQVLFKVGSPYERYGSYRLYLWNLQTNELKPGPQERLSFRKVEWSPNSRFLAYVRGGDVEGNLRTKDEKLELFIHDLQTGQSRIIASGRAITRFVWTAQNALLFSQFSEKASAAETEPMEDTRRPDLYEVAAAGGEPQRILQDGYLAAPSPDGQWIAFYTSTQPEEPGEQKQAPVTTRFNEELPRQAFLSLYNRAQNTRLILRPERDSFSELRWSSDSKNLIITKQSYSSTGQGQATVDSVDASTQKVTSIATLNASDGQFVRRPSYAPQFIVDDLAATNSLLPIKVYEIKTIEGQLKGFGSIQIVDLLNGQVSTLCQFKSVFGYDWHNEVKQ